MNLQVSHNDIVPCTLRHLKIMVRLGVDDGLGGELPPETSFFQQV